MLHGPRIPLTSGGVPLDVTITSVTGDVITGAAWDRTKVLFVGIDNENGDDSRAGGVVAPALTTFTTEVSSVAWKTLEKFRAAIPRFGNRCSIVLLLKPRSDNGSYKKQDGTTSDWLDIAYENYACFQVRGSDLTNSTNDHVDLGGVIETGAEGPNGDSSWTLTGISGFAVTVAAGTLPAQDALAGLKLQFKGDVTAAARVLGNVVCARSSASVFDVGLSQTLANGDDFFFMTPGVKVTTIVGWPGHIGADSSVNNAGRGIQLAGLRFTAAVSNTWAGTAVNMQFCRFDAAVSGDWTLEKIGVYNSYRNEGDTANISTRCGIDCRGDFNIFGGETSISHSAFHGSSWSITGTSNTTFGGGCYFLTVANFRNARDGFFGGFSGVRPSKCVAGIKLDTSTAGVPNAAVSAVRLGNVDVDGATNGVIVEGIGLSVTLGGTITGTTTGSAILLSSSKLANVYVHSTVTMTGTPDITMSDSVTATIASLATSPQIDPAGNMVVGTAGQPVKKSVMKFSGVFVGAAGAATCYLADAGPVAATVLAAAVKYPMPACRVRNLRATATVNPLAGNLVVRVLKNGAASGITVTITAGSTALFTDTTNEAQFNGTTDYMDIDMTETGVGTASMSMEFEVY